MAKATTKRHPGIDVRHARTCSHGTSGRCTCSPSYRAMVYSSREERMLRRTFPTLAEAKAWRAEAAVALRAGRVQASPSSRLGEAAQAWIDGADSGAIRNRSGDEYKPSAVRGYEQALRLRVLPEFGSERLADISRGDLQRFVDRLLREGVNPSTIRNTLLPVRAIFRRALARGEVAINPTIGLELPAVRARRDRIASPSEAVQLLGALDQDHAVWATAMYSGLRLGELLALDWACVDFAVGVIRVRRSWDRVAGFVAPKSRAGVRVVPMPTILRDVLLAHQRDCRWQEGLVFGRAPEVPFLAKTPYDRALRTWRAAGMRPITFHECRHTFASFMIAAGVNAKALSVYMGHSSVTITFDLYGHLMPGSEAQAAGLLDRYLSGDSLEAA